MKRNLIFMLKKKKKEENTALGIFVIFVNFISGSYFKENLVWEVVKEGSSCISVHWLLSCSYSSII